MEQKEVLHIVQSDQNSQQTLSNQELLKKCDKFQEVSQSNLIQSKFRTLFIL